MKNLLAVLLALPLASSCTGDTSRVATLSAATPNASAMTEDSTILTRRAWVLPAGLAAISPDGRSALTSSNGALELRDIETGTVERLTSSDNSWLNAATFGRSGREVLYVLAVPRPTWETRELHIRNLDTGEDRVLQRFQGKNGWTTFGDLTPDGHHIVVGLRDNEWAWRLALVSIVDGSVKTLKSVKWRSPGGLKLSADGRFIAYDLAPTERTAKRDIFVMAIDGSNETQVTRTRVSEHLADWSLDGATLLFTRDEGGSRNLWRVPIRKGARAGDDQLVRRDVTGMQPLGFLGARLFYTVPHRSRELQVTSSNLDSAAAGVTTSLFRFPGWFTYDVSPSGAFVAYFGGGEDDGNGPVSLFVRSLSSGEERELELPLDYIWALQWTDDPQVLEAVGQRRGRDDLYRIDLKTGSTELIPNGLVPCGGEVLRLMPLVSATSRERFYLRGSSSGPPFDLVACPQGGGAARVLYQGNIRASYLLSNDGKRIAAIDRRGDTTVVLLIPTSSGNPVVIHRSLGSPAVDELAGWTSDGSALLANRQSDSGRQVVRLPLDGSGATVVWNGPARTASIRVFPDRKRLFSAVLHGQPSELWVMEGFTDKRPTPRR